MNNNQMNSSLWRRVATGAVLLAALGGAHAEHVILPGEGALLNRLHIQFRWEPIPNAVGNYRLQIVEDDGSANPFVGGFDPITRRVAVAEPRRIVTSGLEFGRSYAWRVIARVTTPAGAAGGPAPIRGRAPVTNVLTAVRRFQTKTVPIDDLDGSAVPVINLDYSAGAGVVQPGVTLWTMSRRMNDTGHILATDESGKLILHLTPREESSFGDMRMMENGRLFWNDRLPIVQELTCRRAVAGTLNGLVTWQSSTDLCGVPQHPDVTRLGVHHEVFPMPTDAPRGANFLLLEYDNRFISYTDPHDGTFYPDLHWQGDVVNEIDRHTFEIVKSWSTFDDISLDDHLPSDHDSNNGGAGGDWNHANAAIYDVVNDRVWVSLREQSRLVGIDWGNDPPVADIHLGDDSIVGSALHPGPFPSGDVDFGDNLFSFQHAPEVLPSGNLLVYNNGNFIEPYDPNDLSDRRTTAVEIAFDNPAAPTSATIVSELTMLQDDLTSAAYAFFVGDADRLPNGNTLVVDGPGANIMELDPSGNAVWFLDAGPNFFDPAGVLIYRVEHVDQLIVETPGDTDGDWDIDLHDWARLQVAYTAQKTPLTFPDVLHDHDGDGDIDPQDLYEYAYWLTGPGR